MPKYNQAFDNFEEWVRHASSWLTRHPQYLNTEHGDTKGWRGHHFTAICFDTQGRLCRKGADFMRARDEGTFPIRWIWPDQIPFLVCPDDGTIEQIDEDARESRAHGRRPTLTDVIDTLWNNAIQKETEA